MRAFIAVELPAEIKSGLTRLQEELKASAADVKWVNPENCHLTLKFLGEINEKQKEGIIGAIKDTAQNNNPFAASIINLGAFPKMDFPRIIWVGLDKGDDRVKKIAAELEEKLEKIGFPREAREFSCHITIGRVRSGKNRLQLVRILKDLSDKPREKLPEFCIGRIILFKSTLTPQGPFYENVNEAALKTT